LTRRLVELSHRIDPGMTTYPGIPGPAVSDYLARDASAARYAPGTTFHIARVDLVANTGTYVDAPFHRYADGADVAGLPLERLADLPGALVDASRDGRALSAALFAGRDLAGKAVLVRTDWSRHFGTPAYGTGHPFLARDAAEALVAARAALVGIDSLNIDDAGDLARPAHTLLLAAGIPIVEHLRALDALPPDGFRVHAVPPPFRGLGSFPARVYAILGDET
jgi:kynurenine formamidase